MTATAERPTVPVLGESVAYRDLVGRIDSLSPLEEFSLLVLPPWAQERFLALMVCAYADESEDARLFAVSGLLGYSRDWFQLEGLWKRELAAQGIPEFHAAPCENAIIGSPFEHMDRDRRDFLQTRFYGLLAAADVWGSATGIEVQPYRDRKAVFAAAGHEKPYHIAFQHTVEAMAITLDQGGFPKNEPIAFVFDQNKEHEGRALELYDWLRYGEHAQIDYGHRLGSISFDSRFVRILLQAADVWAYESRKWVSDVYFDKRPARWQYEILHKTGRFGKVRGFNEAALDKLIELQGWK